MPRPASSLVPLAHGALNHCFGCGRENRTGLRLTFYVDDAGTIVCHTRLARRFSGPPGHAHGGIIATLLDEAMSKANRARSVVAMTRHMEVDYLRPVPLGVQITLTARHVETHGRRHFCEAQIVDATGHVLATGKAVFVAIDPARFARKAEQRGSRPPLP
ncbi:MAG TPA: PaaI family thioesterase [Acidobacteriaceae bacterium]|jgi:uncharacterized protein (TIGR00369 family)|nr:PaaI family thioesterase [Acidobacteriaceae bacterium]